MKHTFKNLAAFLDRFGGEVEGRAVSDPPEEEQIRLRRFARGQLPAAEHPEIFARLKQHPHWIAWLAHEVKTLRPVTKTT